MEKFKKSPAFMETFNFTQMYWFLKIGDLKVIVKILGVNILKDG